MNIVGPGITLEEYESGRAKPIDLFEGRVVHAARIARIARPLLSGSIEREQEKHQWRAPQTSHFTRPAIRSADRSVNATNVRVPFVHPAFGSVGDPTTKRFS